MVASTEGSTSSPSVISTTQPPPTQDPKIAEAALPDPPLPATRKAHRRRRFKYVLGNLPSIFMTVLSVLWIGLLFGIPVLIMIVLGIVTFLGIPLALSSAFGAVTILTGNGILRAAHMAHYTNNASAAAIGATGANIASLCLVIFFQFPCLKPDEEHPIPWYINMASVVAVNTLSGTIGSAILLRHHVDLGGIDILHATRAGALGGTILGPGAILVLPIAVGVVGILLTPLWIAMMMGFKWIHAHSSESWDGAVYRRSSCVTYGWCGDDPEMEEELAKIPERGGLMLDSSLIN